MAEVLLLGCKKRNAALLSILAGLIGRAHHGSICFQLIQSLSKMEKFSQMSTVGAAGCRE